MRKTIAALFAVATLVLAGCGDDPSGPDPSFRIAVRAVDPEGHGVAGLELMVLMDSNFYQDGLAAAKAAVRVSWDAAIAAAVTVTVEDVAGAPVRTLIDETLASGSRTVVWDGRDEGGEHQQSGLYYARLIARDESDQVLYDQSWPMYMALMDSDVATIGVTDHEGRIIVSDKRLFPYLYGDVAMDALDESGEAVGIFPLVPLMRFYLRDPRYDHSERFDREVTGSGQELSLPWQGVDGAAKVASRTVVPGHPAAAVDPETGPFDLRRPYPNPFN